MSRKILTLFMGMVLLFALFQPNTILADEISPPEGMHRGDKEIMKSGKDIRGEIDLDTEDFDTHNLKDIPPGKKEFYKAYQKEFDDLEDSVPGAKIFVKLMKRFDYQGGEFDCKRFDIVCHIVNFMYVTGTSIINFLVSPLSKLAIEPEKIMNDSTLNKFKNSFNTFTASLLGVFLMFQILKIYVFRFANHSDTIGVLNEKIVRVFIAGILLFLYSYFFQLILTAQYRVNYGIFNYLGNTNEVTSNLTLNLMLTPNGMVFVLFLLAFAVLLGILFFQMTYTFALIALFYVIGPVAIITMVNDDYNMFTMWLRTIIARFLTLALQGLCVVLCFSFASKIDWIFEGFNPLDSAFSKIIAVSFLIVGITLPGLLKEFGNSSGSGRGAVSGAQSITRVFSRR